MGQNWRDSKIFLANGNKKRAGFAILILDKIGIQSKYIYTSIKLNKKLKRKPKESLYEHQKMEIARKQITYI